MSWDAKDLSKIPPREPLEPDLGGARVGLLYPGKQHVLSGVPEAFKTGAMYTVSLEIMRAGGSVVLIDFEMGEEDARALFEDLGATAADFGNLHYIAPDEPATADTMPRLYDLWQPELVIIDAAAGAYELQGLDDNKRLDVQKFSSLWLKPWRERQVATAVLDHVVKSADNRGGWVIGSERKVGGADVHLGFEPVKKVRRGTTGRYEVLVRKDRYGRLHRPKAADFVVVSDPETHALTATFVLQTEDQEERSFRPTYLMERVSRFLEEQPEPVSRNRVEENVKGKREYVRAALDALVHDGCVTESAGHGTARLFASARPYREVEADSPHLAPAAGGEPEPVSETEEDPTSPRSPQLALPTAGEFAPSPRPPEGARGESPRGEAGAAPALVPAELPPGAAKPVRDSYRRGATRAEIAEAYGLPLAVVEQLLAEDAV